MSNGNQLKEIDVIEVKQEEEEHKGKSVREID